MEDVVLFLTGAASVVALVNYFAGGGSHPLLSVCSFQTFSWLLNVLACRNPEFSNAHPDLTALAVLGNFGGLLLLAVTAYRAVAMQAKSQEQ